MVQLLVSVMVQLKGLLIMMILHQYLALLMLQQQKEMQLISLSLVQEMLKVIKV